MTTTFEVSDSTHDQRRRIISFLESLDTYEGFERLDERTWNFSCSTKDADDLTDTFEELNLEYHLV